MLVKEEADMDTDDREGGLGKRVCRRKKKAVRQPDFVYQRRGGRESRSSKKKGRHAQELHRDSRLVKIELDAAQALADFSRLAYLPVQQTCPSDLKWSERRKRTPRSVLKLESQGAHVISKICMPSSKLRTNELESTTSLSHGDKASPIFDSRAESPSSPLPSSKLACRAFFVSGGFASNLSARRDVSAEVIQKSVKKEMKELESDNAVVSSAAKRKPRALKPQVPLCLVKMEPLGGQPILKGEGLQHSKVADSKVQPLAKLASQLVELRQERDLAVVENPKTTMTEDDKEARRLRRIQANRESARQTIRKKQLLCEDLRRQSASLASENDAMKQKRDRLMQELAFLRGQNYHLKMQLDLRSSSQLGSQELPSQLASLPPWQASSVPVFGWPRMMTQEVHDSLVKKENTGDIFQKLGSMQCPDVFGTVPGIPASSLGIPSLKDMTSILHTSVFEGRNGSGVAGTETGLPCDVNSTTTKSQQISGKGSKPEHESAIQARGSISQDNLQGDCGFVEKHSIQRATAQNEGHMGLKVSLPVTCGSSCTASIGSIPMNGQGFVSSYPWRMTHATPTAAAEARKRRKELTRRKRLGAKASKLMA